LTLPAGAVPGIKGGYLGVIHTYPSEMSQTFWTAITAWATCTVVTIVVSLATQPRPDNELHGLVYALTPRPRDTERHFWQRPMTLGGIVLVMTLLLNFVFF
jgi:SSS family solute:Na+ symporter